MSSDKKIAKISKKENSNINFMYEKKKLYMYIKKKIMPSGPSGGDRPAF